MEYWIYLNSKKSGPYSAEQLAQMSIPPTTLVWHEGLSSWVSAVEVPELAQKYSATPPPMPVEEDAPVSDNKAVQETEVDQEVEAENVLAEVEPHEDESATDEPIEPECEPVNEEPANEAPPAFIPEPLCSDTAKCTPGMPPHPDVKCPPTYLVWAILTTLCCCQPFGVVAIIYAVNVKSKYDRGDVEGAKKNSERAALWVILAFVVGLVTLPLQSLLSALTSM